MQKANKVPAWGLLCSQSFQAPSRWGEGAGHLLERVLEARAGKWTQRASALQGISLKQIERERERERKQDTGTKALMEQRCFIPHCVGIYTVLQDSYFQQRYYHMVHKKEEGTYHQIEKLMKEMPGFLSPRERLASPLNSWIFRN